MVKEVIFVDVNLELITNIRPMAEYLKDKVKRTVLNIGGIEKISVNFLDEPSNWDRFKERTRDQQST